jgi:phosphoserine aminotransferase
MTKINISFNPGPSQLYFTVEDHIRKALREGIPSISHRSKTFIGIHQSCISGLRQLLNVPDNFGIYFTGSATEIWERIIENLVDQNSTHFINGDFSQKIYDIALELGKKSESIVKPAGQGFEIQDLEYKNQTELIAITHNETSTGVSFEMAHINYLRDKFPNTLIAVDAVSSLPYPDFDFKHIDSLYFSVQKGFGLPAGLGVWIANERCLEKAHQLKSKGLNIGSYHNLPSLHQFYLKHQTPETPNVLAIYLLDKVIQDMLRRGIHIIRKETEYKAAVLYAVLEKSKKISPAVSTANKRSKTVIVAHCANYTSDLRQYLEDYGMQAGEGYGSRKTEQLRFANFPAHSKEQFEALADYIEAWETK